jgi:hypothetical protein
MVSFSTLFSLKSDWDVIGANSISPRYNSDYKNDIITMDDVSLLL